jgi:hypothetical protein
MNDKDKSGQCAEERERENFIPEKTKDDIACVCLTFAVIGTWIYFYYIVYLEAYGYYLNGKFAAMDWNNFVQYIAGSLVIPCVLGMLVGMFVGVLLSIAVIAICATGKAIWLGFCFVTNHNVSPAR